MRNPQYLFRLLLLIIGLTAGIQSVRAQNYFYEVYGPDEVDLCLDSLAVFFIETDAQLERTIWSVIPDASMEFIGSDTYSAFLNFHVPGTYMVIATSTTVNQETLMDTVFVTVVNQDLQPDIAGCYEYDIATACYEVCAFSHTIFSLPGTQAEIIVTGADHYTYLPQGGIDIVWGPGGNGQIAIINFTCAQFFCFTIYPEPTAAFTTEPPPIQDTVQVCTGQEIAFQNESLNGLTHTWSFGDGTQYEGYDATHTYDSPGIYTVTLTAEGICECADEAQLVVEVLPVPAPVLDCVNSVCPDTRQRYTATPAGCAQYTWSVSANGTIVNGGGTADDFIEIIWAEGPDGYITLSVDGCATMYCSFVNTFRIPIITPDGPITGDATVCAGEISTYSAPYFPGATYQWSVGAAGEIIGDPSTHAITVKWDAVSAPTPSSVSVVYDNCFLECGGSASLGVLIAPAITLTGDIQVCQNESATVDAFTGFGAPSPVAVSWQLLDADGQVVATTGPSASWSYVFSVPAGIYTWVGLNSSPQYCTEVARLDIEVTATPATPLGILGERRICPGEPYGFTIDPAGVYGTEWTITDGPSTYTYSGQTCQHTFGPVPPYRVEAIHTNVQYAACQSAPVSILLEAADDLLIAGPAEGCLNAIDTFSTDYISGGDYTWQVIPADHGEIRRSDLNRVEVFWSQSGPVTLRLLVCGVTIDHNVLVHDLPVFAVPGPLSACVNEVVTVNTDLPAGMHNWYDAAENTLGTLPNIDLYPGSYGVAITDDNGCVSHQAFQITSYPAPIVHLSSPVEVYHCNQLPAGVAITANTDGTGYTYEWFRDGVSVGPGGPVFTVLDFGTYHVAVTNGQGCTTLSDPITYFNCCPPASCGGGGSGNFPGCVFIAADFMIDILSNSCSAHEYHPQLAGIEPGQTTWIIESVSEGLLGIVPADVLSFTYDKPGYYLLGAYSSLTGFPYGAGTCGHAQKIVDTIRAVADFTLDGICAGTPIAFEDLTTFLPGEVITAWLWDFGDPASGAANTSSLADPDHTFAAGGTYAVSLTITLASGCSDTRTRMVTISDGPPLAPVYDASYCEDEALAFHLPGAVFDIVWDFDDPASGVENSASADSVFHTYGTPGAYTVSVAASDIYGCRSQTTVPVNIVSNTLSGLIDIDPATPLCVGDTATLTAPSGGVTWQWNTGEETPAISVVESNAYNVLMRDAFHCAYAPPPVFVQVFPKPVIIIRAREILGPDMYGPWSDSLSICAGTEFELSGFATGQVTWQWVTGEVTQVIQFTNEGANLPGPGLNTFILYTTDVTSGCVSDSALIHVNIIPLPVAPLITLTNGSGCSFTANVLTVSNPEAGVTYEWSDGQTGTSVTVTKAGAYWVTAINPSGCSQRSNILTIEPSARVDLIPGGCYIECDPLTVCLPPLTQVSSYVIYHNGVPIDQGTVWPDDYTITADGSYTIEVTSLNGCVATSEPLDIVLYTGVGSLTVETWQDLDGDGVISAGDVLLSGIPVVIQSGDGLHAGAAETVPDGQFVFTDYPATDYLAHIDLALLGSQWTVLLDSVQAEIATCDDSVVVRLLLANNCVVSGPDQFVEMCPGDTFALGDSIWTDTGTYEMHMYSSLGCDSVFQVIITQPVDLQISGAVWMDVDRDGVISAGDTLVPGISVLLTPLGPGMSTVFVSDAMGAFAGSFPRGAYALEVDESLLMPPFEAFLSDTIISDTACGEVSVAFLLTTSCPAVVIIRDEEICPGDSLLVQGTWIAEEGLHSFLISDPVTFCDTVLDVYLSWHAPPAISGTTSWSCVLLGSVSISVTGDDPFDIAWSTGVTGDTLLSGLAEGAYAVTVTDARGCAATDTFAVTADGPLTFTLPASYTVQEGDSVLIEIGGDIGQPGLVFSWSPIGILSCPTCPASFATPDVDTTVSILITDADSCTYFLETHLIVLAVDQLFVPNVFSPNGDGHNDRWTMVSRMPNTFVHKLMILDRWGTMILTQSEFYLDSFGGWDGTFRGKPYNPGVFAYVAELTLGDGRRLLVKGDITLVR